MRALALDVGLKRIGVAISDELGVAAHPVCTIQRSSDEQALEEVARLAREYEADQLVVGVPLNMNGTEGEMARFCREFARKAGALLGLEPIMWDERLTSHEAERFLVGIDMRRKKRKKVIDQLAAMLILESWMAARSSDFDGKENESC